MLYCCRCPVLADKMNRFVWFYLHWTFSKRAKQRERRVGCGISMQYSVHICIAYFDFMQFSLAWNWFFACMLFAGCKCGACSTLVRSKHATCVASAGGSCGVKREWKWGDFPAFLRWNICKYFAILLWNSVMTVFYFKIWEHSLLCAEIDNSQAVEISKCQIVKKRGV
jgi:hypothetical protein